MTIKNKLDRAIVSVSGEKSRGNSRYVIVPAAMQKITGLDGKAEMFAVELDDGTKGLLIVPFTV